MSRALRNLDVDIESRWQAFCQAALAHGVSLPVEGPLSTEIRRVLGASEFVTRHAVRYPEWMIALLHSRDLDAPRDRDAYRLSLHRLIPKDNDAAATELSTLLRRFRRDEMLRIAWRDLAGRAPFEDILTELSHLADACIESALDVLHEALAKTYGQPAAADGRPLRMLVIGMGKLGARELNFSSDVDLIFAFAQRGQTSGAATPISHDDFFTRLARQLIQTLSQVRQDGFVFRVDTGLRPYGESGPLAMSFNAMETYYQSQGREWERYAWIKARVVAGDKTDGRALLDMMRPFVYRRYLDYGVFESLREMKNKIALEVRRQGMDRDVKLGAGGIREIEFFAQFFQLIRGGVTPALQERRLLNVLRILADKGYIGPDVRDQLAHSYIFLRRVEHRLQAFADQQTHRLPATPLERERLARAMDFGDVAAFEKTLQDQRDWVHRQFSKLLEDEEEKDTDHQSSALNAFTGIWQEAVDADQAEDFLRRAGYDEPGEILESLAFLRKKIQRTKISADGRRRYARFIPQMLAAAVRGQNPAQTIRRIVDILVAIGRRSTYLALLAENPPVLRHLVQLVGASHFIATLIARWPVLLDELIDPRTLYAPPGKNELAAELNALVVKIPADDLEFSIESICIFRQVNTLRVAAADVTGVLPLMRVSDHLSELAEIILQTVVGLAWDDLTARHGHPTGEPGSPSPETAFGVVAYGKLGGV